MYPRIKPLAALLPILFSSSVMSAEPVAQLDGVIVTATRTARTTDDTLQAVTVITREDIEKSGARDVMGLLERQSGINVARSGGMGKTTNVYMRGTTTKHVLVLVDGVRAASATLGEYDWNALSPEQIERIEIVRGPRASLYGSDAVGGVIQIFTRQARGVEVNLRGGSFGTNGASVAVGGGESWRYSLNAGYDTTDGTRIFNTDSRRYGFERKFAGASLGGNITEGLSLNMRVNQSWGRNELDRDTGNQEFVNRTASLQLKHRINPRWQQSLTVGHQLDRMESFSPYTPATIETNRASFAWQHDLSVLGGLLSLGIDHWTDQAEKDRSGAVNEKISNTGYFIQHQFEALASDWQAGARRDEHEVLGGHNTWNLGWGKELGRGFRLTSAYGTAFKAPTVNDLFWPYSSSPYSYSWGGTSFQDVYITRGNSSLQPETSKSAELGLRYRSQGLLATANFYETRVKQLIEWTYDYLPGGGSGTAGDPYVSTYDYYPGNIGSVRIRGMELTGETLLAGWNVRAAYTRLLAINLETQQQLDRRPANSFALKASRSFGPHRLILEGEGYSERLDASGVRRLPGYGLMHAGYEYAYSKDVTFRLRLENVLDKEYALARSSSRLYEAPGRAAFASVRFSFR